MVRKTIGTLAVCTLLAGPAMADQFDLTGVLRDFKRGDQPGGHPDFQTAGAMGRFGHVTGLVDIQLGNDNKPVYAATRPSKDTVQTAAGFAQWYNDTPGVNVSQPLTLTLNNGLPTPGGVYTYSNNAFWPVDGSLLGNQGLNHNFHFTLELHTGFTYQPGQVFKFTGDDDVWVYVDDMRVIDLGGVHAAINGSVLLFDGKAFVNKSHFTLGGPVKSVSSAMKSTLHTRWTRLGLSGTCPIVSGDYYIDLDLNNGGPDVAAQFNGNTATVNAGENLSSVTLRFVDGTQESFSNLTSYAGTFQGTGTNSVKTVLGAWVTVGTNPTAHYFDVGGAGYDNKKLDFFFAERHTTQSNFRIDTNMHLQPIQTNTISALYD